MLYSRLGMLLCAMTAFGQEVYHFQENGRRHTYSTEAASPKDARAAQSGVPIFYDLDELPAPEKLAKLPASKQASRKNAARRLLTEKIHIQLTAEQWKALQATEPLRRDASTLEGWTVVRYRDAAAAWRAILWLNQQKGFVFHPLFAKQMVKKQSGALQRQPNDPLFLRQWHLGNDTGLRMRGSWDVATGRGINITVIDDGLDVRHEDLVANAYPVETGYHFNFNSGPDEDPTPSEAGQNHGTSCAGLIAARGFNNIGVIGVAPEARLIGLRLIAEENDEESTAVAFLWQPEGLTTHVSSNSWGPNDDGADSGRLSDLAKAALQRAVTTHRDGLGTVFAFSAGNGAPADNSSYDEYSGNRFVIAVGAATRDGKPSSYSEPGMAVAVSAFGGEFEAPSTLWTTNNTGQEALDVLKEKHATSGAPIHYSDMMNGTSAAAPQVSGAAALLLERNPRLSYRDVKEILMRTARRDGLSGGDAFDRNSAGLFFSHSFGAGILNVAAALEAASDWRPLGPLRSVFGTVEGEAEIPDGSDEGVTATFDFRDTPPLRVEHVELTVDLPHDNRGDLGFAIISPSGMVSIAEPREADENEDFLNFTFTSVRHWGEDSSGVWRVKVLDTAENELTGLLLKATVRLYGTAR